MDRTEAFASLKFGEARFRATAGCLLRGDIRRLATSYLVDFYEEKGWLESLFIFKGESDRVRAFMEAMRKISSENEKLLDM